MADFSKEVSFHPAAKTLSGTIYIGGNIAVGCRILRLHLAIPRQVQAALSSALEQTRARHAFHCALPDIILAVPKFWKCKICENHDRQHVRQ